MITCENCGTAIDIEKNKRCPNCGASYARNKDYHEYKNNLKKDKEYDFREREADIKAKELANKVLEKQANMVETTQKASSFKHKRTDPLTKTTQKKHPLAQIKDQHKQSTVRYGKRNIKKKQNKTKEHTCLR